MSRAPPIRLELPRLENRYEFKRTVRPKAFAQELARQITLHGDRPNTALLRKLRGSDKFHGRSLLSEWTSGSKAPRREASFALLDRLERRYHLPKDYFRNTLLPLTPTELAVQYVTPNQHHIVRWHLPKDFDLRSPAQRKRIMAWLERNVLSGATEFGRRQKELSKGRFYLRLPTIHDVPPVEGHVGRYKFNAGEIERPGRTRTSDLPRVEAPDKLVEELTQLVKFKRTPIAPPGMMRTTGWGQYSAFKQLHTYCRMFGAFVASPNSTVKGFGAPLSSLTLGLLVIPAFWDWLLGWHERRRGFFTAFEKTILVDAVCLIRRDTGWIRQTPGLAKHLVPIKCLISAADVSAVRADWDGACDKAIVYLKSRIRELARVAQVHRDSFQPIITVLNRDAPLQEYRKIADEVLRHFPNDKRYPLAAAQRARAYLLLRFGMQVGLRRRNLSELLVCPKGQTPKSDRFLKQHRRGELRWLKRERAWEIYIPSIAFKNWSSTFFKQTPFRVLLPDTADLYLWIDRYLKRYRPILLGDHPDSETFFVRTLPAHNESAEFVHAALSYLWRDIIIKFGIYNPYTDRGAIEGLLPHGPHSVRDVIATHLIKRTSSYELAAYALHCTPKVIEKHYCRFLAEEKTAIAAKVIGKIWEKRPPRAKLKLS